LIRHNGRLIGGMVDANSLNREENISQWITVLSVDDVNVAAGTVVANGGKILREPTELRSRGVLAIIEDPTGALFAMVQTKDGDPADYDAEINGFLWDELWTGDVPKTADFYTQVIGFEREDREIVESGITYHMLTAEGIPRAGILKNPYGDVPPVWVNYLRVEDPSAVTARVESLGGQILLDTQPRDIGGEVAFIAGPSGAGIALQTWPLERKD
jgi:predicted enzyme related to lactoylglutathione lyase